MDQNSAAKIAVRKKKNCWEVMQCGREPGGSKTAAHGVCPAAADRSFHGINSGNCAGRICWAVAGTFCGGEVQGSFAEKRRTCLTCEFYQIVQKEERISAKKPRFLQFIEQEDRSPFFEKMTYRHVPAGERFVVQGAVEDKAYIIQRGSCLVVVEKNGALYPVDHYGEGDIVGGLGILTGEPRRAHVEAETDLDLWILTKEQFDEFSEKDPTLLDFMTELVTDRLDSRRPTAYRAIGKYVTTDIIGRGGFSIVYKGFHGFLRTPVVIKMMRHNMAMDAEFINGFHHEAKTIAALNHEHIVKVFDFDERYRTLFIIMEYVKGVILTDMIAHLKTIPQQLAVQFLYQICDALSYAHSRGIIHRDINPANIIIQPNNQLKILDFGLACPAGTEDFTGMGTAHYMAPEQINGEPLDPRTDIYAVGITAFEMVTGARPFPENDLRALRELHRTCDIPDPKTLVEQVPEDLRQFILQAARCDPNQRYRNMEAAMDRLRPMMRNSGAYPYGRLNDKPGGIVLVVNPEKSVNGELLDIIDKFKHEALSLGATVEIVEQPDAYQ